MEYPLASHIHGMASCRYPVPALFCWPFEAHFGDILVILKGPLFRTSDAKKGYREVSFGGRLNCHIGPDLKTLTPGTMIPSGWNAGKWLRADVAEGFLCFASLMQGMSH